MRTEKNQDPAKPAPPPAALYKYRSLASESRGFLKRTLVEREIFFASRTHFNDPFDCRLNMTFSRNRNDYVKELERLVAKKRPELNRQQRRALARRKVKEHRPHANPKINKSIAQDLQDDVDRLGIFCLCEQPDHILMWSHYADAHTGVCLEFSNPGLLGEIHPVTYARELPSIDFMGDDAADATEKALLTKAIQWEYEAEWRVIDFDAGSRVKRFPPHCLTSVILGCRVAPETKADIEAWLSEGSLQPRVVQAEISEAEYGIEVP